MEGGCVALIWRRAEAAISSGGDMLRRRYAEAATR